MGSDTSKRAFVKTWGPKGYRENFYVYEKQCGLTEQEVVEACLEPYFNQEQVALEIGCGGGFWMERYLIPNFKHTIGLDLLPEPEFSKRSFNCNYIEVPDRDYSCYGVDDVSIDFVWSFGVFCHLSIGAIKVYLDSTYRVLKPGGKAVLFFSNTDRRSKDLKKKKDYSGNLNRVGWCKNNWKQTYALMTAAGFKDVHELLPGHSNTLAHGTKPYTDRNPSTNEFVFDTDEPRQ